jgi:O-antigen ligase
MIERASAEDRTPNLNAAPSLSWRRPSAPFLHIEYGYYLAIFYSYNGPALGITVPYLATLLILGLALFCALRRRSSLWSIHRSIFRPIACILSFLGIQYYLHGEGISDLISFIVWAASIVIIQSSFFRSGFLHRLAYVMFLIGVTLVPFMNFRPGEGAMRAGLATASVLSNPNSLGVWFGFCGVYFLVRALKARRIFDRLTSVAFTIVSLLTVGLTVSRSALIGVAIAGVICFRDQLKRGFLPLLIAMVLACGGFAYGLFDNAIGHYVNRGTGEEGRTGVLPYAFQRFVESPLAGVGITYIGTVIPGHEGATDPHNALLFLGLSSGIVPLILFLAYCMAAFKGAQRAPLSHPYHGYLMPLLVYCLVGLLFNDTIYMFPWFVAALAACLTRMRPVNEQVSTWQAQKTPEWIPAADTSFR